LNLESEESRGSVVTVLSGGPGEGKSTTLFNLAFVSAQAGQRVLLMDSDLRRPSVHRTLGIENGTGVADLMQDEHLDPHTQVLATEFENLFVIPAGEMPSENLGAFNSARLRQVFDLFIDDCA
jgi:Mrp family chromosome partitioning ATPase